MFVQDLYPFQATTAGWDPWSVLRRTLQVGPEHLFKGKGNGDEEEDGADGAGLVVDDEVGGVEDEQEQVAWQHEQGWPKFFQNGRFLETACGSVRKMEYHGNTAFWIGKL